MQNIVGQQHLRKGDRQAGYVPQTIVCGRLSSAVDRVCNRLTLLRRVTALATPLAYPDRRTACRASINAGTPAGSHSDHGEFNRQPESLGELGAGASVP